MTTQHTPGQWVVGSKSEYGTYNANMIFDSQGGSVAMVYGLPSNTMLEKMNGEQYADGKARARLIAAAPDLLKAAKTIMENLDGMAGEVTAGYHESIIAPLRDAIAKATEVP
jgi:hypothetical protein